MNRAVSFGSGVRDGQSCVACARRISLWIAIAAILVTIGGSGRGTPSEALAATDTGYRDFSFAAPDVGTPTGEKPQSKLWFNDGSWWGVMFNKTAEEYHIYRYDRYAHQWNDTGTVVDERNNSKADALWDGGHLYVASAGPSRTNAADSGRFLRYSYDAASDSYSLDAGFPITITEGGMEAIVLERDTLGRFWATYTRADRVLVTHSSDAGGQSWEAPFTIPVPGATNLSADDISAVVSFDSKIGVMWSNQNDDAMYFATHNDGDPDNVWQSQAANQGPGIADDHINLKSLQADPAGRVFAVVKTSLGDEANPNPDAPLNLLMVRDLSREWTNHTFGRVRDRHTRPIVLIDQQHQDLYVFATAPTGGGTIYYKKTSLLDVSFADGRGTPFIESSTDLEIDDATSTKQSLNSQTRLLVLASDSDTTDFYLHNYIDLGATTPPPPTACTITGTSANDTLTGTSGDDVICGLGGNDTIKGLAGNDTLKGDDGADKLFGGPGNDTLDGGAGVDTANFSSSKAGITASLADGTATGEGADTLAGIEILIGSKFNDALTGDGGANTLTGGAGNDEARGGDGADKVTGSGGADSLFGESGNDTVNSKDGVNGNDSLDGGDGTDKKVTDATEASIVGFP